MNNAPRYSLAGLSLRQRARVQRANDRAAYAWRDCRGSALEAVPACVSDGEPCAERMRACDCGRCS